MKRAALAMMLAGIALLESGCPLLHSYTKKPKVTLKTVDVIGVDFQEARLRADLEVQNQIPVPLTVDKIHWGVKIEGNPLVSGDITTPVTVAGNGVTPVSIPFALKFEDLYKIGQKYKDQDEAPYRLEGSLALNTPIGPIEIPFSHDGKVPVLKIPELELAKADVKNANLSGVTVKLVFNVKNPNNFGLNVSTLDYALTLAGSKIAQGNLPSALDIAAKGAGTFETDIKVSVLQATQAAQALASRSSADYSIGGTLAAKTPWGDVSTPYAKSGTVKIQH